MVATDHAFERPQQRRTFLELGREMCAPDSSTTANTAKIESQEAEALASSKVYDSTLLFINLDLQFGQFFPEPFLYRRHQPVMSRVDVDQDHQIIRKPCVLYVGVLAEARGLLRPLQHPIYLCEVEVTEQRRDYSHYAISNFLRRLTRG